MSDKKIIFDGRFLSLSHAGLGRYTLELLNALLPLDLKQKYILLVSPNTKFDKELSRKIYERENPVEIVEIEARHYSFSEQYKLLKLLKELKGDLVHFPHFNHPLLYKGQFVVTIHDLTLSQYAERGSKIKRNIYKKVIDHAAKKSSRILTVSDFVKRGIAKEFSLPPDKIVTTYNGIDEKFCKITNPKTLKKVEKYGLKNPYILSLGQWREHKNLLRLVEAFSKVSRELDKKRELDLVFVGRDDPKYPFLKQKIQELHLGSKVRFTGFVEDQDLPVIYNNATLFVMPSLSEGFGLPGLEAQACHIPVIASNATCLPEVYGNGAIYFDPLNSTDMALKINEVLSDTKLRDDLVKRGSENTKRFSWDKTARKTLEVYSDILYKK